MLEHPGIKKSVSTCRRLSPGWLWLELSRWAFWRMGGTGRGRRGDSSVYGSGRQGMKAGLETEYEGLVRWLREVKQLTQGHTARGAEAAFDLRSV